MWRRFWRRVINALRRDFLAGLLVFVPVGFTLLGVLWLVDQLDKLVLPNNIFRALGLELEQPRFLGAAVTLVAILLAGALTRSFVGRGALGAWEAIVERIPVARSLYAVLKQFMAAIVGDGSTTVPSSPAPARRPRTTSGSASYSGRQRTVKTSRIGR